MQGVLQQIAEVLKKLLDCCSEMVRLSKDEGEVLKANDIQKLFGINETMTENAAHLSQLELERAALHSVAVHKLNLSSKCGLKEFLAAARSLEALDNQSGLLDEIDATADSLSRKYKALKEQTEINQMLVRQSISYIDNLMEVLSPEYRLTYKRGGEVFRNRMLSPFVNQTV